MDRSDDEGACIWIGHNPASSRLPYVLRLPVAGEGRIFLATRETWPRGKDVFCSCGRALVADRSSSGGRPRPWARPVPASVRRARLVREAEAGTERSSRSAAETCGVTRTTAAPT